MDEAREAKKAWLCRYRESIKRQERIGVDIRELRGRSVGIVQSWNIRTGPTGAHSAHVADTAQRIDQMERELQAEQRRGQEIAADIIIAIFKLPLKYADLLSYIYLEGMSTAQAAKKMGLAAGTAQRYRREALAAFEIPDMTTK